MRTSRLFLFVTVATAAAAAMLSGCSKERPVGTGSDPAEVKFTGNVAEIVTRVSGADGTVWDTGDPIGIYMFRADGTPFTHDTDLAINKRHIATAGTSATFAPADGTPLYYPTDGSGVKFLAFHPHGGSITSDQELMFSVASQANLSAIDVLHAPLTAAYDRTATAAVPLEFEHKLSKLVFNVANGAGVTEPVVNGMTVAISGQKTTGELHLITGAIEVTGTAGTLTATASAGATTIEAIVIPSSDLADVTFTFTNNAGQEFDVEVPTAAWEGGKRYTYTVTLKAADKRADISGTIDPWGDGGTEAVDGNEPIAVGAEAGKRSLSFVAGAAWTATVEEKGGTRAGGSNVEWLRLKVGDIETYEGAAGTVALDAELDTNYSGEARSARIVITHGTERTSFRVAQSATDANGQVPVNNSGTIVLKTTLVGEWTSHSSSLNGILLCGSGNATIDWGDGSEPQTVTLNPFESTQYSNNLYQDGNNVEHTYTAEGEKTVTITGDVTAIDTALDYNNGGNLTSVDVSLMPGLTYLECDGVFSSLDVSDNTALTYLYVMSSNLSSLDVDNLVALKELRISGNLSSLDVDNLAELELLSVAGLTMTYGDYAPISELDVSANAALRELYCSEIPHVTSLDVSGNTQLHTLHCIAMSGLEELNVQGAVSLQHFDCMATAIQSLDLRDAFQVSTLFCRENKNLTALDLTGCPWLQVVQCNDNNLNELRLPLRAGSKIEFLDCGGNQLPGTVLAEILNGFASQGPPPTGPVSSFGVGIWLFGNQTMGQEYDDAKAAAVELGWSVNDTDEWYPYI